MPQQNRVTPHGDIVAFARKGQFMGNRGCLHVDHDIVRPWNGKRWITCVLEFRGWVAPQWQRGRWTALFFDDEAVALAAGHRPCALCRRGDYVRYCEAIGMKGADAIDARLHVERLDGRRKRRHAMPWRDLPDGTFVEDDGRPALVFGPHLYPWSVDGSQAYGRPSDRPPAGDATVITPVTSVLALQGGLDLDRLSILVPWRRSDRGRLDG
jgi:hypothetical protein